MSNSIYLFFGLYILKKKITLELTNDSRIYFKIIKISFRVPVNFGKVSNKKKNYGPCTGQKAQFSHSS